MAFRYLIYRTDYGNTIVRETPTDTASGGTELSTYSDFIIPEIQPVYLWRYSGSTTPNIIPNLDSNVNDWLGAIAPPPEPDDNATIGFVTGITENKIDKVTGATGNLGTFLADGNLEDSGVLLSSITGNSSGVTQSDFNAYTGATDIRLDGIDDDIAYLSGATDEKIDKVTGATGQVPIFKADGNIEDSGYAISGLTGGTSQIFVGSGATEVTESGNTIIIYSPTGVTSSGLTGGTNGLTAVGQNVELGGSLSKDTSIDGGSSYDLNFYNLDEFNVSFSGVSTLSDFGNNGGIHYGGDYSANYVDRSLVDAGYVTGLTSNLQNDIDYISGQTDLKLNITNFNTYTGNTDTRLDGIESDIVELSGVTSVAITGATNGLTKVGRNVLLGGNLTQNTIISGTTHDFTVNTSSILLQSAGASGIELIDTAGADIYIETDGGAIQLIGNTGLGVSVNVLEISETTMKISDGRATPIGIVYSADYSASFTDESLVTKRYVDSVAAGLTPKASVDVASTANIDLSTGGLLTIDGVTLSSGERILVKDQTDASQNGIYSANTGAWGRTTDFDGNPDGEVVDGNIIPVVTGDTQYNTLWVLITPDPITVGTTDLEFTLFSSPVGLVAGNGIDISGNTISVDGNSLAGNSISWTGNTFNVDIGSGTLSTALDSKLNVTDFNTYSGNTDTRLDGIESDIVTISGETANKLDINVFTGYTATTDTRLDGIESDITYISGVTDTKLDTSIFTGYTATTVSNEIFLTHTGGTDVNVISPVAIDWDTVEVSGSSFLWSGGSDIYIKEGGDYEINYNIPFNSESVKDVSIGGNIVKNNSSIIDVTAAAGGGATNTGTAGSVGLPTVIVTLALDDKLTLGLFRTEKAGTVTSSLTGSILIKKKNTLQ